MSHLTIIPHRWKWSPSTVSLQVRSGDKTIFLEGSSCDHLPCTNTVFCLLCTVWKLPQTVPGAHRELSLVLTVVVSVYSGTIAQKLLLLLLQYQVGILFLARSAWWWWTMQKSVCLQLCPRRLYQVRSHCWLLTLFYWNIGNCNVPSCCTDGNLHLLRGVSCGGVALFYSECTPL